jgi:hypothetical protein
MGSSSPQRSISKLRLQIAALVDQLRRDAAGPGVAAAELPLRHRRVVAMTRRSPPRSAVPMLSLATIAGRALPLAPAAAPVRAADRQIRIVNQA